MTNLILAFTGTSEGVTVGQIVAIRILLEQLKLSHTLTVRHGVCVGADEQFHEIARNLSLPIIGHPGVTTSGKSFKRSEVLCDKVECPEPFLQRNRTMVDLSHLVIAAPAQVEEQVRSGTWATIRYARRVYRQMYIVWPKGTLSVGRGVQVLQEPM